MESKNESYLISLDAGDLNLLPISQTHKDGGAVPLWSKSNLDSRRKEYYEFIIKSDDTKDQNELVIENVTCHMCDINVPKGYFNEHKNGFRHKFNRKVADTALKRLQLYVNKDDVYEFNEKLPSKHFCTECSIVINSEDETSHKQTTGHKNSRFLEIFFNDFLHLYMNDDNKIDDTRKDIKTEVVKENENSEEVFVSDEPNTTETVVENLKKESMKEKDVIEMKDTENYKTILNSDELNNNLSPSSDLQDKDALEAFDGPNINKLKVTEMSEMCYDDNSTKFNKDLTSDENKSSTGTNKNTAPVNKGTRNSLVPSSSSYVAKNSNKTVKLNPNSYLCTVCQVEVPNNEKNIATHNKGISHMKKLRETKAGNKTKIGAISNLHYQMKKTERLTIVTCIVCNTNLTYNDRNISKHVEGDRHKRNYKSFCKRNLLVPRDKFLYCTACGVIPGLRNEFAHCSGRNHKLNLEKVVSN